ncbi:MAG: hypothetical protein VW337_00915, partial [Gammaproteobacteria bacterium]
VFSRRQGDGDLIVRKVIGVGPERTGRQGDDAFPPVQRLGGVDDQVHDDLVDLRGVGQDRPGILGHLQIQVGVLADGK